MSILRRGGARGFVALLALLLGMAAALPAAAAEKPRIQVDNYQIDAQLLPRAHRLIAHAVVKFTALDDITAATFELHNALRPTRVTDDKGTVLSAERISQDSTVRVSLPNGLAKGASSTLNFDYEGILSSADDSPVQGLKLAYISDDTSYLLYAGRWFPMVGYGTDRFTATIRVTVPADEIVIGSGQESSSGAAAATVPATPELSRRDTARERPTPRLRRGRPAPEPEAQEPAPAPIATGPQKTYTFVYEKPGFPGTIIAGHFEPSLTNAAGLDLKLYFKPNHKDQFSIYSDTAVKEFQYYAARLGPPLSNRLTIVELPDDTVSMAWGPEIVALASRSLAGKVNYRLLANGIARQWWGADVSPASKDDWWLGDGFARYEEAEYVEAAAGEAAFQEVVKDMEVGALAYDSAPLSSVSRLDTFSPEFQSLVTDKGAIILNMLRWVIGDQAFQNTMQQFFTQYGGKPATVDDFRAVAEKNYGQQLTWFFTQWLDSTGAPEFKTKYTIYRVAKGFRIVGEISQDLDLFRMPVELKIDTDGKSEDKRIEVVGTNSAFTVETYGKPRKISVDPDNRVLKNSEELKVRAFIQRGQGLVQQGDLASALEQFQKALDVNKNSSLAHYRIAEVFFLQRNYQAAANAYREALNGDGEPRWTEVWSHIQLGKIFDLTGQRERATNEYRQALQTNDNTQGAQEEARKYLQSPYQSQKTNGD